MTPGRAVNRALRIPRLHVVTDDGVLARRDFLEQARRVLEAGGEGLALHLRGPGTAGGALYRLAESLASPARQAGSLLMVNDRVDVVLALGLPGVHLGQRSLPPAAARRLLGGAVVVGVSVHGEEEARDVPQEVVDFLLVGAVFATPSHPGQEGAGLGLLGRVAAVSGLPLVAIGGITPARVREVVGAGAHGVAVKGGVWDQGDPAASVGVYARELQGDQGSPGTGE